MSQRERVRVVVARRAARTNILWNRLIIEVVTVLACIMMKLMT
jgi:hypothetical protein